MPRQELHGMGCDGRDSVSVEIYPNPNGHEPGEPERYGVAFCTSGLFGLDLMTKDQLRRVAAEFSKMVEALR